MYDFNVVDLSDGARTNAENFESRARVKVAEAQRAYGRSGHAINDLAMFLPEYIPGRRFPGEVVGYVYAENKSIWAQFVYRGVTKYNGNTGAVLDIVRRLETMPDKGPVVLGFSVVDISNLSPLLIVLNAGSKVRIERKSCT